MEELLLSQEKMVRLGCFLGVFALVGLAEFLFPRRARAHGRLLRWSHNLGLTVLNGVVLRLLFPVAGVGVALLARDQGWGLLAFLDLPAWADLMVAVLLLDFVIFLQHVLVHAVPALWRLHRMHHADTDIDVTSGLRFHPLEMILSMVIKLGAVAAIGPSAAAVVLFEVLLNATAMFNHGNVHIPVGVDRILRWVVVTPDMHRVHHSVHAPLANSNFGFNFPWWDRLMGCYVDQPPEGHQEMEIGLEQFRDPKWLTLPRMLAIPFWKELGEYAINRRW